MAATVNVLLWIGLVGLIVYWVISDWRSGKTLWFRRCPYGLEEHYYLTREEAPVLFFLMLAMKLCCAVGLALVIVGHILTLIRRGAEAAGGV